MFSPIYYTILFDLSPSFSILQTTSVEVISKCSQIEFVIIILGYLQNSHRNNYSRSKVKSKQIAWNAW